MSVLYATVSAKGQVTIPAAVREELGIRPGQKVAFRVQGRNAVIEAPPDAAALRAALQEGARASGNWGREFQNGDGWDAHVQDTWSQ